MGELQKCGQKTEAGQMPILRGARARRVCVGICWVIVSPQAKYFIRGDWLEFKFE